MSHHQESPAFIATLGLSPQIITRALDEILEREKSIGIVSLIHTAMFAKDHPHWRSLTEFSNYIQTHYNVETRLIPIKDNMGETIWDIRTIEDTTFAYKTIQAEMKVLKHEFGRIHALIAGGRKSMVVYTMIAAQFIFDNHDKLWHLFSTVDGDEPHEPTPATSHLVEVPVVLLSWVSPVVRQMVLNAENPAVAFGAYDEQEEVERMARLSQFYNQSLNDEQREILVRLRRSEMEKQIATAMNLGGATVNRRVRAMCDAFVKAFPEYRPRRGATFTKLQLLIALDPLLSLEL